MPVTTRQTTINEKEIREAIVAWLLQQGDGILVDPDDIVLTDYNNEPLACRIWAKVDH